MGSLIYDPSIEGIIGRPDDIDRYTIEVDSSQMITVVVDPEATLQPTVELRNAADEVVGAASPGVWGADAVVQSIPATMGGTYTVVVGSAGDTTGSYSVRVILNAAVEAEAHGGPSNDDSAWAEDLDGTFLALGPLAASQRGAVLGTLESNEDWYSFTLQGGTTATLALTALAPSQLALELYDGSVDLLAAGAPAANVDQIISNFAVTDGGTYYARVSGGNVLPGGVDYSLMVLDNAAFDAESNDDLQTAQPTGGAGTVLGYLAGEAPAGISSPAAGDRPGVDRSGAAGGAFWGSVAADANPSYGSGGGSNAAAGAKYSPGRLIVRFADSATKSQKIDVVAARQAKVVRELPIINGAVIELPNAKADILQAAAAWSADPAIRYAEPDYEVRAISLEKGDTIPNDPMFSGLYGMHNTGQTGGTPDADIDAPAAWDRFTGSGEVVIASIDTGIDYTHEDLAANMWVNPGEIAGDGIDNDGNGYIDDIYGIDPVNNDSDPLDDHFHGTHTAGTFGAIGDNGIGVAGVNWNVKIMALKFLNSGGSGSTSGAIASVDYLTMMKTVYGVNVVVSNNSWGGGGFSQALMDAIEASNDAGIMFVAAAGNSYTDNDVFPHYPSSYELDGVIAVAATDHNDQIVVPGGWGSNYGATSVDLGAPGDNTLSTFPSYMTADMAAYGFSTHYETIGGTSMASPHVAGAVGLLAAYSPTSSLAEIKAAILDGADPLPSLDGITVSGARLNLAGALALMGDPGDFYQVQVNEGDILQLSTSTPGSEDPYEFENLLDPALELYDPSGALVAGDDNGAPDLRNAQLSHAATAAGTYTVRVLSMGEMGEYVLHLSGHTGDLPPFMVAATDPADGARLPSSPLTLVVDFSDSLLMATVNVSDLTVDGFSVASAVHASDGDTLVFDLPPLAEGPHEVAIAAGAVLNVQGTPLEAFAGQFVLDFTAPRVIASSIQESEVVPKTPGGTLIYTAVFDEEIDASRLTTADVALVGAVAGAVAADSLVYDPDSLRLTLEYRNLLEDDYTLVLTSGDGALEDRVGNDLDGEPLAWPIPPNASGDGTPGGDFVVHFSVDADVTGAREFFRLEPFGGLMSQSTGNTGRMNYAGDEDAFSLMAASGELISAIVTTEDETLSLSIELVGVSGPFASSAPGEPAILPPVAVAAGGEYRVRISGDTQGSYELKIGKNLIFESSVSGQYISGQYDTGDGNELSVDASLLNLDQLAGGWGRYGVLGTSESGGGVSGSIAWGVQPQSGMIVLIDPATGNMVYSFDAPDALAPGHTQTGLSMAEHGDSLLYVNSDVDPTRLYRLDPLSGAVLSIETIAGMDYDGLGFDFDPTGELPQIFLGVDLVEVRRQDGFSGPQASHFSALQPSGAIGGDGAGRQFAYIPSTNQIVEFDPVAVDTVIQVLAAPEAGIEGLAFDGRALYASTATGNLYTLDPDTAEVLAVVQVSGGALYGLGTMGRMIGSGKPAYLRSTVGQPWGSSSNEEAMDAAFGAGNWDDLRFETADPATLFSPEYSFVFMEGGADSDFPFEAFVTANIASIEDFVSMGGVVLLNSAPWSGSGMSFGFGGVNLDYPDSGNTVVAVDPAHDVFNGPFTPVATTLTGNSFSHASVSGGDILPIVVDEDQDAVLAELQWGSGLALFGGMTTANFHSPQPDGQNLRANILAYAHPVAKSAKLRLPEVDGYRIDLTGKAGRSIDVVLAGQGSADFSEELLQLIGPDGNTVLATAASDPLGTVAGNYDLAILDFVVPAEGVYTLRLVSTTEGEYGIVITDSLIFDSEPNDALADPLRSLDNVRQAIGYLRSGPIPMADPQGDTFGGGAVQLDIRDLSAGVAGAELVLTMNFFTPIAAPSSGAPEGIVGFWDLDLDQDPATGGASSQSVFAPPDQQGGPLGVDVYVNLGSEASTPGQVALTDAVGSLIGTAPISYGPTSFEIRIPLALLGDDGSLHYGTVIGTFDEPTDAAPDLEVGVAALSAKPDEQIGDRYEITLSAGEELVIHTQTPLGDPANSPLNDLNPGLVIYDSSGAEVASDTDGFDGRNARVELTSAAGDTYTIEVIYEDGSGEYLLLVREPAAAEIAGRHIFYNNSAFDGNDPAANAEDDGAIAPDKQALMPGQTAEFANYTSYVGGINGIMVDVLGMAGTPDAGDFVFRVGNNDSPDTWAPADAPRSVTVRPGAGVGGSDRVTIIWPDNAIEKQWLEVTLPAGGNLGLAKPEVFYFGNAIGDTGNSTTDAKVTAIDMLNVRNNQRNFLKPPPIDFSFDFDRNARVDASDMLIARNNVTHFLNALKLITVPNVKTQEMGPQAEQDSVTEDVVDAAVRTLRASTGVLPAAKADWLYEFEQTAADDSQHRGSAREAVDELMALWQ